MAYNPTIWRNGASPAINAPNLNKIEQGILESQLKNLFFADKYTNLASRTVFVPTYDLSDIDAVGGGIFASARSASTSNVSFSSMDTGELLGETSINRTTTLAKIGNDVVCVRYVNSQTYCEVGTLNDAKNGLTNLRELSNLGLTRQSRLTKPLGDNTGLNVGIFDSLGDGIWAFSTKSLNTGAVTEIFRINSSSVFISATTDDSFYYLLDNYNNIHIYTTTGTLVRIAKISTSGIGTLKGILFYEGSVCGLSGFGNPAYTYSNFSILPTF